MYKTDADLLLAYIWSTCVYSGRTNMDPVAPKLSTNGTDSRRSWTTVSTPN